MGRAEEISRRLLAPAAICKALAKLRYAALALLLAGLCCTHAVPMPTAPMVHTANGRSCLQTCQGLYTDIARSLARAEEIAVGEDEQRMVHVLVVVPVEEAELLLPGSGIVGGVDVEDKFGRRLVARNAVAGEPPTQHTAQPPVGQIPLSLQPVSNHQTGVGSRQRRQRQDDRYPVAATGRRPRGRTLTIVVSQPARGPYADWRRLLT